MLTEWAKNDAFLYLTVVRCIIIEIFIKITSFFVCFFVRIKLYKFVTTVKLTDHERCSIHNLQVENGKVSLALNICY